MAQKIASLYAEITADSSRAEAAIANTKTALAGLGNSFGDTALKQQLLNQRTAAYRNSMKDLASQVMTGKMSMEDASKAANNLAAQMGLGESTAKRSRLAYMDLASKVFLAQQAFSAVSGAAQQAWKIIGEGAELQLAEDRFDRLAVSIGSTADAILTDFEAATGGMVSNAEMIASASQIIELGLAGNAEDVVRLGNVVGQLGLNMQQVILTFANDSKMRLDSLGLSVTDVEVRTKAYTEAGIAATKAFDMAVLDALEARLERIGSATGTLAGDVKVVEANWANFVNTLKQGTTSGIDNAESLEQTTGALANYAQMQVMLNEEVRRGNITQAEKVKIAQEVFFTDLTALDVIGQLTRAEEARAAQLTATTAALRNVTAGTTTNAESIKFTAEALDNYMSLESAYARQGEASAQSAVSSWRARQEAIEAYGRSLNEGLGLEAQYAGAAQLATTQTNNAALKAAFYAEQQDLAAQATAELTDRLSDSFVSFSQNEEALADYTAMMQGVATVSHEVGGRTAEQTAELDRLQGIYDKAQQSLADYNAGLKGVGLSEEALATAKQKQIDLMENAQTAMAPLLGINSEYITSTDGGAAATAALNSEIYKQIEARGMSAEATALAAVSLGVMTQEEANARLSAALLEEEIRKQAAAWDGTAGGLEQMQVQLGNYIDLLNNVPSLVETEYRTNWTQTGNPPPVTSGGGPTGSGPQPVEHLAAGGIVTGGVWGRDSVPALLMPGEEVLPVNDPRNARNGGGRADNRQWTWNVYTSGFNAEREQRNANAMAGGI